MTTTDTIRTILDAASKYRDCYFWDARRTTAAQRRREEFDREYEFAVGGDAYQVRQHLSISCRSYYYGHEIVRNGKPTNITPLKNALRKLQS